MLSRRGLLTLAVLTFVVGIVSLFPARIAYRWFAPDAVSVTGISGTIWRGHASQASANGIYLQDIHWRAHPVRLLTGRLAYSIEATPASGFIEGTVGVSVGGTVKVRDLSAALPLDAVAPAFNLAGIRGNASAQFERIEIKDGLPVAADGQFTVANFTHPRIYRGSIGGYRAEFFTQADGVVASVEDTDGSIDIAGSLQVGSDRTYQFIAKLAPKPNTPASIQRQLQILGSPDERGQRELRLEGEL